MSIEHLAPEHRRVFRELFWHFRGVPHAIPRCSRGILGRSRGLALGRSRVFPGSIQEVPRWVLFDPGKRKGYTRPVRGVLALVASLPKPLSRSIILEDPAAELFSEKIVSLHDTSPSTEKMFWQAPGRASHMFFIVPTDSAKAQ